MFCSTSFPLHLWLMHAFRLFAKCFFKLLPTGYKAETKAVRKFCEFWDNPNTDQAIIHLTLKMQSILETQNIKEIPKADISTPYNYYRMELHGSPTLAGFITNCIWIKHRRLRKNWCYTRTKQLYSWGVPPPIKLKNLYTPVFTIII